MLIKEFTVKPSNDFSIANAVEFHDELNPKIFDGEKMRPEIRDGLLEIAEHFKEFIGIDLDIVDITVSGSNAAYSYTPYSDIDLHLVVRVPDEKQILELLDAKKNVYNAKHDILVKGMDVELYAQPADQEHHSQGIYSVLNDEWVSEPRQESVDIDAEDVREKYRNYRDRIKEVLTDDSMDVAKDMWNDIKRMRKSGLATGGEFSTENLVFKMLRNQGWLKKLDQHINDLTDKSLSIEQREQL
jgi:hypothetical protein